jgi:hypothetical protein
MPTFVRLNKENMISFVFLEKNVLPTPLPLIPISKKFPAVPLY